MGTWLEIFAGRTVEVIPRIRQPIRGATTGAPSVFRSLKAVSRTGAGSREVHAVSVRRRQAVGGAVAEPFVSLWENRQLYRRVLVRDILSTFRGSVLGIAWVVLVPLALVAIYTFVFGVVLSSTWSVPTSTPFEVPLIFFASLATFGFFMEIISRAPNAIRENSVYVKKIVFPLDILAWVLAGTAFFKFLINFLLLLSFLVITTGRIPAGALLVPVLFAPFFLLTVGLAWIFAAIGAYVRDLTHALQALSPVIMFISPIFYAVQQVPEPFRPAYLINPLTFVLEGLRSLLFFGGSIPPLGYLLYTIAALAVFALGHALFQRLRPGFADVV